MQQEGDENKENKERGERGRRRRRRRRKRKRDETGGLRPPVKDFLTFFLKKESKTKKTNSSQVGWALPIEKNAGWLE